MGKNNRKRQTFGRYTKGKLEMFKADGSLIEQEEIASSEFEAMLQRALQEMKQLREEIALEVEVEVAAAVVEEPIPAVVEKPKVVKRTSTWASIPQEQIEAIKIQHQLEREYDNLPWYKKIFRKNSFHI